MSADFSKNDFGQTIRLKTPEHLKDVLVGKFCRLSYDDLNKDYYNQKIDNFKQYGKTEIVKDFDKAKERMKQQMISSDNSKDNSVLYTAMTQFKKNHE